MVTKVCSFFATVKHSSKMRRREMMIRKRKVGEGVF